MIALFEIYIIQYKILKIKIKIWYSHKRSRSSFFSPFFLFLFVWPCLPHTGSDRSVISQKKKVLYDLKMIVWWTQSKKQNKQTKIKTGLHLVSAWRHHHHHIIIIIIITWTKKKKKWRLRARGKKRKEKATKTTETICVYSLWSMFLMEKILHSGFFFFFVFPWLQNKK